MAYAARPTARRPAGTSLPRPRPGGRTTPAPRPHGAHEIPLLDLLHHPPLEPADCANIHGAQRDNLIRSVNNNNNNNNKTPEGAFVGTRPAGMTSMQKEEETNRTMAKPAARHHKDD